MSMTVRLNRFRSSIRKPLGATQKNIDMYSPCIWTDRYDSKST